MMTNLRNPPRHYYSLDEYFALEKSSNARFEYWDGSIICKSGSTVNKYNLSSNILGILFNNLKGKKCKVYTGCMPIYTPKLLPYRYVDATVVCGKEQYQNFNGIHALKTPTVLFDVSSDTTEHADKNQKRIVYQAIKSLQEYILIAQDEAHVTHYIRQGDFWSIKDYREMEAEIELPSIGASIKVKEMYANVKFES